MEYSTLRISALIKKLESFKDSEGDVEVFMENSAEACFDGVSGCFAIHSASDSKKYLALLRNDDVLKP